MYKNKIKKLRVSKNMTLKQLADEAEISAGYLSHLEMAAEIILLKKLWNEYHLH